MKFSQIDHICLLEPGKRIEASKSLTGKEDYLRDHFPRFAVMPGVLMLEALFQASAILVRETDGYQHGLVLLKTVKNVKFADFVQPGQTLDIACELVKHDGDQFTVKATGSKEGNVAVGGRLVLEVSFADNQEAATVVDQYASLYMRNLSNRLQVESAANR